MKQNSNVSFINTNVWLSDRDYDANVTAALFDFNDKTNTWNVVGKVDSSNLMGYLPNNKTKSGFTHSLYFGKTNGRFNFNLSQTLTNSTCQINDPGYYAIHNFIDHSLWLGYSWNRPGGKWYNNLHATLNAGYSRRLKPSVYQNTNFNFNINGQLKNLWYAGFLAGYHPCGNDFYEPHGKNRFLKKGADVFPDAWIETNNAKKYQVYAEILYVARSFFSGKTYQINLNNPYRFNDKLPVSYGINLQTQKNNTGFASIENNDVLFGKRNINTAENTFSIKYNFNKKMGIRTDIRHYRSKVDYGDPLENFYKRLANGELEHTTTFSGNVNQAYNAFNIDAVYTWEFAPGSFINLVWKNANINGDNNTRYNYFKNLSHTLDDSHNNNLSLKILYFPDYLQLKNHKNKK